MMYGVPQNIDVEDKIAGPLTGKQLGWLVLMGVVIFLEKMFTGGGAVFYILAFFTALIFLAMAFYRPYGQPFNVFIGSGVSFLFKPKVYIWKRGVDSFKKEAAKKPAPVAASREEKKMDADDIAALARTMDTEGAERSERMMEIIKKSKIKNQK